MKKCLFFLSLVMLVFSASCGDGETFEVNFESNGGSTVESITSLDDLMGGLPIPTKNGYIFGGWYLDQTFNESFDITDFEGNLFTLYAKWISETTSYQIKTYHEALDGTYFLVDTETLSGETNSVVTLTELIPPTGFELSTTQDQVLELTLLEGLTHTLEVYYDRLSYEITINKGNGEDPLFLIFMYGEEIVIENPEKEGFSFISWDGVIPSTMPANNLSFTAIYEPIPLFEVTFYDEMDHLYASETIYEGNLVTEVLEPTKLGYEFVGWTLSETETLFDFSDTITENITLYAVWTPAIVDYRIDTYQEDLNGNFILFSHQILSDYTEKVITLTPGELQGFTFDSDHEDNLLTATVLPDGSMSLSLYYTRNSYTITFESNASLSIQSMTAKYEAPIDEPTIPIRLGYEFIGWYSDEELTTLYEFIEMPSTNFTLYAKWEGLDVTLNFDSNGGTTIEPIILPSGSDIIMPPDPEKEGYEFIGWYLESTYQHLFTSWEMPVVQTTLYAKWTEKAYTITFNTSGGEPLEDMSILYNHMFIVPIPVNGDLVFNGWFFDQNYEDPFDLSVMPAFNFTLYARWMDEADQTTISYLRTLDRYSEITITGTVYAKEDPSYQGFYVRDHSGAILVHSDEIVNIGDLVTITGTLYQQEVKPILMNVTSLTILEINQDLPTPFIESIHGINQFSPVINLFGKIFQVSGVLIFENNSYYLFDRITYTKIKVSDAFHQDDLVSLIDQKVNATVILADYSDGWVVGLLDYTSEAYSDLDIVSDNMLYFSNQFEHEFYSLESLTFPLTDPFGYSSITVTLDSTDQAYYSFETHQFAEVMSPVILDYTIEISSGEVSESMLLQVTLHPIILLSIEDFKHDFNFTNDFKGINGIVIFKSDDMLHGIYDGTDTIYLYTDTYLEIGDEVTVVSKKSSHLGLVFIEQENTRLLIIRSSENPVDYPIVPLTDLELSTLNLYDKSNFGQKVELKGFLHIVEGDTGFMLELDTKNIPIEPISYKAFEDLYAFDGLEIVIRGYISLYDDSTPLLLVEGIRGDYKIPDYTASERVDMILELFSRTYADQEFYSLDQFVLYPYHPVLGGSITYQFIQGEEAYDVLTKSFKLVTSPVPIQLEITITKDDVTKTYIYQTILNPVQITPVADLKYVRDYEDVFIQGIIIYRDPMVAYLLDDTGIVEIEIWDLDAYIGDEVIINGLKEASYGGIKKISIRDNDRVNPVIKIISRENTFTIPMIIGFDLLSSLDINSNDTYNQLIELTGTIFDDDGDYYITNGSEQVYIESSDDFIRDQLTRYAGLTVSIRGFIYAYDGNYTIFFGKIEDNLSLYPYSDQDKLDLMSSWLTGIASEPILSGTQNRLPVIYELFNASITYTMDPSYEAIYDLENGIASSVDIETVIPITATIHLTDTITQEVSIFVTILPIVEIEQVLISDFLTLPIKTYRLQAKIIATTPYNGGYAFIIQDESGRILVPLKSYEYFYNNLLVGRTITVIGHLGINDGRPEVLDADYVVSSFSTSIETTFVETPLSMINQFDLYDSTVYGLPLLVTGTIKVTYDLYGITYTITDGIHELKLNAVYQSLNNLAKYEDLHATLKVFFMGDLDDDGIYDAVITNAAYGGTSTMMYADYSDLEFAGIIFEDLIYMLEDRTYHAYEYVSLSTYHFYYPSAIITYTLLTDPTVVSFNGSDLYFYPVLEDQEVRLELSITYGTATITHEISFALERSDIKSFSDLFLLLPELDEMGIEGQMIYSSWKYTYLLIEGNVYYIEGYFDNYSNFGDEVLIYGKKTTLDGKTDYTYEIEILDRGINNPIFMPPSYTAIEDLDLNNMDPSYLRAILTLYGLLKYDEYLGWYYITPTDPLSDIRVYLRAEISDDNQAYAFVDQFTQTISKHEMDQYLGLPIYLDVLNPGIRILDQYVLVDFIPAMSSITLGELTLEERMLYGKNYLELAVAPLRFYQGDSILYDLPFYHETLELSYNYQLHDPADEVYIDLSEGGQIKAITTPTQIILDVTISYYDPELEAEFQDIYQIELVLNPLELSTIYDVLWGRIDKIYQVEGEIVYLYEDNFMIIYDGSDLIYVDIYNITYYLGVVLELRDSVRITAWRDFYEYGDYIPILTDVIEISILSNDLIPEQTPVPMTLDDILNLNYLLPSTFNQLVSYTGTVIKVGSSYYSYYLRYEGIDHEIYDLKLKPNMEMTELDALLSPFIGLEITVVGYLIGFEYMYEPFDWILLYDYYLI